MPKVVKSNIDPRQYDRYETTDVVQKTCCSCAPGTDTLLFPHSLTHSRQTTFLTPPPDIAECPEALRPSPEWESTFLLNFDALRKVLHHPRHTAHPTHASTTQC